MTNKEWVKKELSLSDDCLTTADRVMFNKVLQDLERSEKLEKTLEIIKNKKVNMYHIWVFDNYQQYKEHYKFSEYHAIEDMLSENEFNLLKKVEE